MTWNTTYVNGPMEIVLTYGDETVLQEGYFLNVSREVYTEEMRPFEEHPETPQRIWSGDTQGRDGKFQLTVFLRFTDEEEAKQALGGLWV